MCIFEQPGEQGTFAEHRVSPSPPRTPGCSCYSVERWFSLVSLLVVEETHKCDLPNGESFMNYLEFYQQLSVLELLCGTIDETHCYQKSQHEEQKKSRTENCPLTMTPQNKNQPEFDTSPLRLSSLQSLSLASL